MSTYRSAYENPIRCKTTEEVRVKLAEGQNYGAEYESYSGQKFSEHGHLDALKKFLPENMSQQVDTQMTWNHKTFAECLNWVKIHIAEQHSYSLSAKITQTTGSKGPTPMQIGSIEGGANHDDDTTQEDLQCQLCLLVCFSLCNFFDRDPVA